MAIPRPRNKPTRYWIDNEFIEQAYLAKLHPSVSKVYDVLARHANARTQVCYPSLALISKKSGIVSRSTVIDAVRTLERYALIDVIRSPHKVNHYLLRDCRTWLPVITDQIDQSNKMTTPQPPEQYGERTDAVQPTDQGSHLAATPIHKSKSEKEIMDNVLQKLRAPVRVLVLSDFENRRTILALQQIEREGVDLGTLDTGQLCYHLAKHGVNPLRRHSWINYDNAFKQP
jgi:hypothetical protein